MSILLTSETEPVINILSVLSIFIFKEPSLNFIFTLSLASLFFNAATAVAQAAVPQALVSPAPLSQTLTVTLFSSMSIFMKKRFYLFFIKLI